MKLLIKLGGTLLESDETRRALCRQIAGAQAAGHQTVVVHGGGKRLSRYLEDQGIEGFQHSYQGVLDVLGDKRHRLGRV